ncbi:hypothetical protein P9D84_06490 [Bacillus vallismortis]|uniref:hypothetical protein n=1 Tax=Bacillus subtilis group TaxID=653685 RepID=UPI0005EF402F|nr:MULTISPECIES: hypothetical protein [Bacillus subtilis group]MCY8632278.1 hypothetical protein [Bacillus spizizenii]MCY8765058.1 hypothetical protein [Bacillus spizizenii]MCY8804624.1 hypothetical protein [Bacillus spizizenii]MEC0569094.1 hypothetical protein [Bacillus spizizenii]MEC1791047.1 hypothetical protein [Bacillus vallismortis]
MSLYGKEFGNPSGYKINFTKQNDYHNHHFGGEDWDMPECKICKKKMHQIILLDLNDERLSPLRGKDRESIPLFSCLNCSLLWEDQFFELDFKNKKASIYKQKQYEFEKADDEDIILSPLPEVPIYLEKFDRKDYPTTEQMYDDIFEDLGTSYLGRVLGKPVLAQNKLNNSCDKCKQDMFFVSLITGENEIKELERYDLDFYFGDIILYFSICLTCNILKVEPQTI